jgi:hypothetical protein
MDEDDLEKLGTDYQKRPKWIYQYQLVKDEDDDDAEITT